MQFQLHRELCVLHRCYPEKLEPLNATLNVTQDGALKRAPTTQG